MNYFFPINSLRGCISMTWQPGESGNPTGGRDRRYDAQALDLELSSPEGQKAMREAVRKTLAKAADGDLECLRWVADRVEGRPKTVIAGDANSPFAWQVSIDQGNAARDLIAQRLGQMNIPEAINS